MNTEGFFSAVLPSEGFRCLAVKKSFGYAHQVLDTDSQIASRAVWLSNKSETVYFACGSLREKSIERLNAAGQKKKMYRVGENISKLGSFWLDLDVGDVETKYPSQQLAVDHLFEFVFEFALPIPLVVNSGYGIHAYFPLSEDAPPDSWLKVANLLHTLTSGYGLKVDPARTRDISSVLRPPGTWNCKVEGSPVLVSVIPTEYVTSTLLDIASKLVLGIQTKHYTLTKKNVITPKTTISGNYDDSLAEGVYEKKEISAESLVKACPALALVHDSKGNVQEPLWYAAIGVLLHVVEPQATIHEWSDGHPKYTFEETQQKLEQRRQVSAGPTTCLHIKESTQAKPLCEKCPFFGSITTPLQLGLEPKAIEIVPESAEASAFDPYTPRDIGMYQLTTTGVIFKDSYDPGHKVEDESKVNVLDYPIIVKASAEDERKGGVIGIEYKHPIRGTQNFYLEKSSLAEKAPFYKEMLKNHIALSAGKAELLKNYMIGYLQELDRSEDLQNLHSTMGWKGANRFVLGSRFLQANTAVREAGLGTHLSDNYCGSIREVGDYKTWAKCTEQLNSPGLDRHALALCFGFGAPIMKMTGYDGALVNLLGPTNSGKSTMLEWLTSIYGDYRELKAQKGDTYNQMMGRLGTLNTLPMVIDEITNIDQKDVSDLIYSISQGREKARMTSKIVDRKPRTWSTLVVSSSNSSLVDKLMAAKSDPEAERMRVIEFWLPNNANFEGICSEIHPVLKSNFGGTGTIYIQYLLNNYVQIGVLQKAVQRDIEQSSAALGKERFWVAALSSAIAGGMIAKKLGLISFDMAAVQNRAIALIHEMRDSAVSNKIDYTSTLGRYLNAYSTGIMFIRYSKSTNRDVIEAVYEPKKELLIRVEHDYVGKRIFVDKQHFIWWLNSMSISSMELVQNMKKQGVLISTTTRKILGDGWANNPNNAAVPTMEFYMKDTSELATADNPNIVLMSGSR